MENETKKSDKIVLLLCMIFICAFVILLPNMNEMVRKAKQNENTSKKDQIPITYRCLMTKENESDAYVLNQDATYTIQNKKVIKAEIRRDYQFSDLETYNLWKTKNGTSSNINGQTESFEFHEESLQIIKKITKDILVIDESDLEETFPKTYSNLLIYTQDQECTATYEKE